MQKVANAHGFKSSLTSAPKQHAYLAPKGLEEILVEELQDITNVYGRLVLATPQTTYWTENIWYNPTIMPIQSISHAANLLRAIQRNWWPYTFKYYRR